MNCWRSVLGVRVRRRERSAPEHRNQMAKISDSDKRSGGRDQDGETFPSCTHIVCYARRRSVVYDDIICSKVKYICEHAYWRVFDDYNNVLYVRQAIIYMSYVLVCTPTG